MSRSRARFTQSDIFRVLKAARQAECAVRVEIEQTTGKLVIVTSGKPGEANSAEVSPDNPWDEVLGNAADKERTA